MSEAALFPVGEDTSLGSDLIAEARAAPLQQIKRQFGKNVSVSILARTVNMARGVLLVPFLLAHIGLQAYGIWTTIFILVSYVGVTTLGLSNVYIKYVAEFHARKEYEKANSLLSTGLAITVPLCGSIFLAFYFLWNWYAPWLRLPPGHAADGREAVLIVLAVFLSSISLNGFGDILCGCQQIAATQWFLILSLLLEMALIVLLVSMGRGIAGLAEAYLARTVLNDGLTIWWAWRKLKWLHLSPRQVRRESIRYVLHFGGLVQFQSMLTIFLNSIERVIGLSLIGAAAAGLLDVAKKWQTAFSTVPMAFFFALLPAASHVDAASAESERKANLRRLYLASSRYSNLCTAAFVALVAWWAGPILHIWLGPQLPVRQMMVPLFVVFSLGMQWHMLTGPGTSMFRGMGRVYEEFFYSIPNLILLAITLPAARLIEGRWSAFGIGVAVTVATIVSASILMGRVLFVLELRSRDFLKAVIVPGIGPYIMAGIMAWPLAEATRSVGRWQGAGILAIAGLIYLALLSAVLYRWTLTQEERNKALRWTERGLAMVCRREATV